MKNANSRFRIRSARYKGPKKVMICHVKGLGFECLHPHLKASPFIAIYYSSAYVERVFFVDCEGGVGVVSALIFTCNVVVFLLIVIVLQLLRGCLHHGPQSCSMFRWPFPWSYSWKMQIVKPLGPFTRCKPNVEQEELNFIIDLSRPINGLFV